MCPVLLLLLATLKPGKTLWLEPLKRSFAVHSGCSVDWTEGVGGFSFSSLPESTAALPETTAGQKFVVVFPENIAYYHPVPSQNKVTITALHDGTVVNIIQYTYYSSQTQLNAGDSGEYVLDARLELSRSNMTNASLQIISNLDITVQAISFRNNSVQSALILPMDKLGLSYLVPPIPNIPGTTDVNITTSVTERAPFRLMIVNADQPNTVTVAGTGQVIQLQSNQSAQIWIQPQDALQSVTAVKPVAVLLGHSCAMRDSCTCGLLYTALSPNIGGSQKFFIPPVLTSNAANTVLLLSDQRSIVSFNPDSPQIESSSPVILYRPGLLLSLIAESDFASCFVVNSISNLQTYVVILVDTDYTAGVNLGSSPLPNAQWQTLKGTDYAWTQVAITEDTNIIWHSSYSMAVYFGGNKGSSLFGNPAAIVSRSPGMDLHPQGHNDWAQNPVTITLQIKPHTLKMSLFVTRGVVLNAGQ